MSPFLNSSFVLFPLPGGMGKAHQLFGNDLNRILDELNLVPDPHCMNPFDG
jgi:hypothetical protein